MSASQELKEEMRNSHYFMLYFLCRVLANSYMDGELSSQNLKQIEHHIMQILKALSLTTVDKPQEFCSFFLRIESILVTVCKDIESTTQENRR
jgi:hypothetical protein